MRIIIHDLEQTEFDATGIKSGEDTHVISDNGKIKHCIGCFGCWVKTPGTCVIKDGYSDMGVLMSRCDELIIVSECTYGGFSPFVKNVLDRSISYVSPHFTIRNKELHHKRRYDNVITINAYLYGADITEKEKETAVSLIKANAINYDGNVGRVQFFNSVADVKEAL